MSCSSRAGGCERLARFPTAPGAGTALLAPELDRLFPAVRAGGHNEEAAIWIFGPVR